MFTNRRPYYELKMSTTDFFREHVRYLKESNSKESMMEKPYLEDEYPKMHLKLPGFKFKPKEIPSIFGPIADGDPPTGIAIIDFGEANCGWDITRVSYCTEGPVVITMSANYLWHAEFNFIAQIASDTIGVSLSRLVESAAASSDKQDYLLTFQANARGSVTVCGFASTHTLVSQIFETVVAGMPVGIRFIDGALVPLEKGQGKPATLLKSFYGDKGDSCGCITFSSSCTDTCECKNIGFSSQGMDTNEQQTLTVVDPEPDCEYVWTITAGGGGLSEITGTSTVYYSPSSNNGCSESPTITLTVNSVPCDTLKIAVNAYPSPTEVAYIANGTGCPASVPRGTTVCGSFTCDADYCWRCCLDYLACDGSFITSSYISACNSTTPSGCGDDWCGKFCADYSLQDVRTQAMIDQGCCPAGL